MTRKVYNVRIYSGVAFSFDFIVQVRGNIMKGGSHLTIEAALHAAQAIEDRLSAQPVYVYARSFLALMADALVPALDGLMNRGGA